MLIKELNLIGFRNYIQESLSFESNKVILIGKNAQGKSNLLELIQVLSLGKSKRATRDSDLVNWNCEDAVVHLRALKKSIETGSSLECDDEVNLSVQIRRSGRRTIKINEITKKTSELAGNIYSVSFMVDDLEIVSGSPSQRRDWIDAVLIQLSRDYREKLFKFESALKQRNSFIKQLQETGVYFKNISPNQKNQVQVWDDLYIDAANKVIDDRIKLLEQLAPVASDYYAKIAHKLSDSGENLEINYLGAPLSQDDLEASLAKDFARGFTNVGPQRQDLEFLISGHDATKFASQGQRRTIVLALKLAELDLLKFHYNDSPILLLDDVLAELDEDRQDFLLDAVDDDTQVVITTTHLGTHLEKWQENSQIFSVHAGTIKLLDGARHSEERSDVAIHS